MTLTPFRAGAVPLAADSACYMTTASGQVIDLNQALCSTKPRSNSTQQRSSYRRSTPSRSNTGVRSVVKTVNGGVTTTVYSAPGYRSGTRSVYSGYNYDYSSGPRTQTSSSSRY